MPRRFDWLDLGVSAVLFGLIASNVWLLCVIEANKANYFDRLHYQQHQIEVLKLRIDDQVGMIHQLQRELGERP